jgi:deoxyribodipyrimidine photo-lyase
MSQTSKAAILWFRRDLRLADHSALAQAVASNAMIAPVFILDEDNGIPERLSGAARWWLDHSIRALAKSLETRGNQLILRRGDALSSLLQIAAQIGATDIYASRSYSPKLDRFDAELQDILRGHGIALHLCEGHLLHDPRSIRSLSGQPYRVFTPFWKAMCAGTEPHALISAPDHILPVNQEISSDRLSDWQLSPAKPNWAKDFGSLWQPGEEAALSRLEEFVEGDINGYAEQRDVPALDSATSRLSPHLAFGEIAPARLWHATSKSNSPAEDRGVFRKEVAWRDFCYGLLQSEPNLAERNWNQSFDRFEWQFDQSAFDAWKRGQTGYPIVDAGMRELWRYGTMHNRVRMIVASFLVKHLLIDWRYGEQWFSDTLVDIDVASNPANWQWVAGSGADAAPFFRIFNPILQGEKFDKQGNYVRRHVPELQNMPDRYIHRPFDAPETIMIKAGVRLGQTYPKPIIDHSFARQRALDAYANVK